MFRYCYVTVLVAATLTGCATSLEVSSESVREADFASYRTFSFLPEKALVVASAEPFNPLLESRLKTAAAEALTVKGYRQTANPAEADILLAFFLGARDQVRVNSYPDATRETWRKDNRDVGDVQVRTYTEGTLSIDMYEEKTRSPVWHGSATRTLTREDRNDADLVTTVVNAILEQFPPG